MKLVVDMNLSPLWVKALQEAGHDPVHWSKVGNPRDSDSVILSWAHANHRVVFTHDLDFGTLLALSQAKGPSVIQVRGQDVTPAAISTLVIRALAQFEKQLTQGALVVVDETSRRVRLLPLK